MTTNIQWPPIAGTLYGIPGAGEVNWPALSNFLIALQNAQGTTAQKMGSRRATISPVTISSPTDCLVFVNMAVPEEPAVLLPAGINGQIFAIVDERGDADLRNITITPMGSDTINLGSEYKIEIANGGVLIGYHDGNWAVFCSFGGGGSGGLITDADVAPNAAIDVTKIGDGTVDNATLNYLAGATSNIQAQINALAPTGTPITDLYGDVVASGPGSVQALIADEVIEDKHISTAAAINAAKIGSGLVSNTEFDYLDGVSSAIQTQLNGKQPAGSYQADSAELSAISALSTLGIAVRSAVGTWVTRLLSPGSSKVSITNANGAAGNPTIDIVPANIAIADLMGGINALLPSQTGNAGRALYTDGTNVNWEEVAGGLKPLDVAAATTSLNAVSNVMYKVGPNTSLEITLPSGSTEATVGIVDRSGGSISESFPVYINGNGQPMGQVSASDRIKMNYNKAQILLYRAAGTSYWTYQVGTTTSAPPASASVEGLVTAESGSITVTTTGAISTSVTVYYSRVGKSVTLSFPAIAGTFVASGLVSVPLTALPSSLSVNFDLRGVYANLDPSVSTGLYVLNPSTKMDFYQTTAAGAWTAGSRTIRGFSISYVIP